MPFKESVLIFVILSLSSALYAQPPTDSLANSSMKTLRMQEKDKMILSRLNAQFIENFINEDVKAHQKNIHPNFICINNDGTIINRKDYMEGWATAYSESGYTSFSITDEVIRLFGDMALVRSKTVYTREVNGETVHGHSIYTDTYMKEDGEWLCVQAQITPVTNTKAFNEALLANGPAKTYRDKLKLYGQFIGTWDIVVKETIPDKPVKKTTAVWVFHWILKGLGIQDVIIPGGDKPASGFGTTLRTYDTTTGKWRIYWADPVEGRYSHMIARAKDGKIVQVGQFKPGVPMHWIFYDISENHFQWRSDISFDGGKSWITVQHIEATRRVKH